MTNAHASGRLKLQTKLKTMNQSYTHSTMRR